jgi:SlyX protein
MTTDDVERLESKIAFLERANSELSDVVYRQHLEIQGLRARLDSLAERLTAVSAPSEIRTPEDERPPHY